MSDHVKQMDGLIKALVTPGKTATTSASRNKLGALLHIKVVDVKATIDSDAGLRWLKQSLLISKPIDGPEDDQCWEFVRLCLQLLQCLQSELNALKCASCANKTAVPLDVLSIQQQQTIAALLQFVTGIGISRNLSPDVGFRSQRFALSLAHLGTQQNQLSVHDRNLVLISTVTVLLRCSEHPALGGIILTKCLGDILAALFQLLFAPLKTDMDSEMCEKLLDNVVSRTYQPLVMRELLVFQGPRPTCDKKTIQSPVWLRKAARTLFIQRLMTKQGVSALIRAILDVAESDSNNTHWEKCAAVARLISSSASEVPCVEEFFTVTSPQILSLLTGCGQSSDLAKLSQRVGASTVMTLYLSHPHLTDKHLIVPVTRVLHLCSSNNAKVGDWLMPSENDFSCCLSMVHKVFVLYTEPNSEFLKALSPVLPILLQLHAFIFEGASHLRSICIEILCRYFKHVEYNQVFSALSRFLFPFEEHVFELPIWNSSLKFSYASGGGVVVDIQNESQSQQAHVWLDYDSTKVASLLSLISEIGKDRIVVRILIFVLQSLPTDVDIDVKECISADELRGFENTRHREEQSFRKALMVLQLVSVLCEQSTIKESVLNEKMELIELAKAALERGASGGHMQTGNEILTIVMEVLSVLIPYQEGSTAYLAALKSCLPALDKLKKQHASDKVRSLASELQIAILTESHGHLAGNSDSVPSSERQSAAETPESSLEEVWKSLSDPDPPIRGHALLSLTKLVQIKDAEALRIKQKILKVFQENLKNDDSYVYLIALQGLSSLATLLPDSVLPCLLEEYTKVTKPEIKMKLGEAIAKTIQNLGPLVPKYREQFLNALLYAAKDPDPDICASALAILGEACQNLKFALGPCLHEVFNCIVGFIKFEPSVSVRRAALQVLTLLLRGIGKEAFNLLSDLLRDVYRLLKYAYNSETDDIAKLHAQLALQELDIACRQFIFPKQTMEKKIQILD